MNKMEIFLHCFPAGAELEEVSDDSEVHLREESKTRLGLYAAVFSERECELLLVHRRRCEQGCVNSVLEPLRC